MDPKVDSAPLPGLYPSVLSLWALSSSFRVLLKLAREVPYCARNQDISIPDGLRN